MQEDGCYITTAVLYGVLSIIALVQLVRIQLRVPEYGWTTQKVFHLLNFLCSGCTFPSQRPIRPHRTLLRGSCSLCERGPARSHLTTQRARGYATSEMCSDVVSQAAGRGAPAHPHVRGAGSTRPAVLLHLLAAGALLGRDLPPGERVLSGVCQGQTTGVCVCVSESGGVLRVLDGVIYHPARPTRAEAKPSPEGPDIL